jgi:hypothetical protein
VFFFSFLFFSFFFQLGLSFITERFKKKSRIGAAANSDSWLGTQPTAAQSGYFIEQ